MEGTPGASESLKRNKSPALIKSSKLNKSPGYSKSLKENKSPGFSKSRKRRLETYLTELDRQAKLITEGHNNYSESSKAVRPKLSLKNDALNFEVSNISQSEYQTKSGLPRSFFDLNKSGGKKFPLKRKLETLNCQESLTSAREWQHLKDSCNSSYKTSSSDFIMSSGPSCAATAANTSYSQSCEASTSYSQSCTASTSYSQSCTASTPFLQSCAASTSYSQARAASTSSSQSYSASSACTFNFDDDDLSSIKSNTSDDLPFFRKSKPPAEDYLKTGFLFSNLFNNLNFTEDQQDQIEENISTELNTLKATTTGVTSSNSKEFVKSKSFLDPCHSRALEIPYQDTALEAPQQDTTFESWQNTTFESLRRTMPQSSRYDLQAPAPQEIDFGAYYEDYASDVSSEGMEETV